MQKMLFLTALLGAVMAYGTGCGDDSSGSGGTGAATNTGGTGGTGGATNTGGSGGSNTGGGGGTGGSNTGGGGGTGGSNTGGTGGTTMTGAMVNGCDSATAEDHLADATTTVSSQGFKYNPPCIKIKAGSSVKFMSMFMTHPLVGGVVEGGAKAPDAASPITSTSTGAEATFAFPTAGTYGYYCDTHALGGMMGAVFVE